MDQFEAIRAQADELRREVGVADALRAIDVVRTCAGHLDLEIRLVPPHDDELEGAHGILCREFGHILVRDDLAEDELAEVLAHEIGHFRVHNGTERGCFPRSDGHGGDPSQRIETYGIKERREAQANSFGRELVLPRALAARLFLGGRRAAGIAADLGVRHATAYQQLADGLLLPEVPRSVEPPAADARACDGSQQRAVDHRGTPFLVRAGPGTGKTRTLTARVLSLLAEGVPAEKILALTFSNKAARELSGRVTRALGSDAVNIWAGTFHAFGLDTIRKHHSLFGVSEDPRIVDASEGVALLEDALTGLDLVYYLNLFEPALALRDLLRGISRAKDELWTPEQYMEAADAMRDTAASAEEIVAAEKAREVATVYDHYQRLLTGSGAVDYGDLIMRPTLAMREDADFRALMRDRFSHVLVDEYQDINRASAMLVREIVGDGRNLWVVGDARQSIYRFRGASAANVARFERDYPAGRRDGLEVNYRSTAEIVGAYSAFGAGMGVSGHAGAADLVAARGAGGERPALFACADEGDEMDALAGSIRDLEAAGVPLRSQTVLARSNGALARFAEELGARDVPVLYLGPLFAREEVKDLLSLLSIIVDGPGTGLVRVGGLPEYGVSLDDILFVVGLARDGGARLIDLLPSAAAMPGVSAGGRRGLALLADHLDGLDRGTTPWLALSRYLFDKSDYVRTALTGALPSDVLRRVAVRQLLDTLRVMPMTGSRMPIARALDRIRNMILLADERDLRHLPPELDGVDGVRLMTVHASKGLEFEAVHLPGLYAGAVPSTNRPPACQPPAGMLVEEDDGAHEAEEECVLFVGMSRAVDHLRVYRPLTRGGRTSNPSRFLSRVSLASGHDVRRVPRVRPSPTYPPVLEPPAPPALTASDVDRYCSCPRQFLYERVLRLARRGRTGAYLDAHGCLQEVLAYVRGLAPGLEYDRDQAVAVFDAAWSISGLEDHPFGGAYRRLAVSMLDRLHGPAAGSAAMAGELTTTVGGETIAVAVDRIVVEGGARVVRNIRSGRRGSDDADRLSATMLIKAVKEAFGEVARIENHYLLAGDPLEVTQTAKKFGTRVAACEKAVADIRRGSYDPIPSDFRCPRCAYLFICAAP